jgi:hypothetical protein
LKLSSRTIEHEYVQRQTDCLIDLFIVRELCAVVSLVPPAEENNRNIPLQPYSGAWTAEEKRYATALIQEFRDGNIPGLSDKTTMRSYLAEKLGCPTKRISKKYEGTGYNGRLSYAKEVVALDPEEALRRQHLLLGLERDFRKSRAAIVESKESSPKRVSKTSCKAKKMKSTVASVALVDLPRRAATASTNELRSAMKLPPVGTNVDTSNPSIMDSLPSSGMHPSQDMMLEAMILERSRIAAGLPSSADLVMSRRASMFNPLNYYGTAGLLGGSNGLNLQAAGSMGNRFGALFPTGGMVNTGLGLSLTGAPFSSSLGASGQYYVGSGAATFGGQPSAGLQSSFLPGFRHPSTEEEVMLEAFRRKRDMTEAQANAGGEPTGNAEAKKHRGA